MHAHAAKHGNLPLVPVNCGGRVVLDAMSASRCGRVCSFNSAVTPYSEDFHLRTRIPSLAAFLSSLLRSLFRPSRSPFVFVSLALSPPSLDPSVRPNSLLVIHPLPDTDNDHLRHAFLHSRRLRLRHRGSRFGPVLCSGRTRSLSVLHQRRVDGSRHPQPDSVHQREHVRKPSCTFPLLTDPPFHRALLTRLSVPSNSCSDRHVGSSWLLGVHVKNV